MKEILIIFLFITSNINAQTTRTFFSTKDNTIYEAFGSEPMYQSNGKGIVMFSGVASTNGRRRGLIYFDLSTLNIPQGESIIEAKVILKLNRKVNSIPYIYQLHRVSKYWDEGESNTGDPAINAGGVGDTPQFGDCTWDKNLVGNMSVNTQFWDNLGGDFVTTVSARKTISTKSKLEDTDPPRPAYDVEFEDLNNQLANDIQFFIDNPNENFGWIIRQEEDEIAVNASSPPRAAVRFYTSEAAAFDNNDDITIQDTPRLVVTYGMPPLATSLQNFVVQHSENNEVILNWTAENDFSIDHFIIKKSSDGQQFLDLGIITKKERQDYQFIDYQAFNGLNYYQLNAIDINGNVIDSQIQTTEIHQDSNFEVKLLNNGQSRRLQLQIEANTAQYAQVVIYNFVGKILLKQDIKIEQGQNLPSILHSEIAAGNYFITIGNQKQTKFLQWINP